MNPTTNQNHSTITNGEATKSTIAIKNLIAIKNQKGVDDLVQKVINGEKIHLNIADSPKRGKELRMGEECVLVFDVCHFGSKKYNANSIIRDLAKTHSPEITRKTIEALVRFE